MSGQAGTAVVGEPAVAGATGAGVRRGVAGREARPFAGPSSAGFLGPSSWAALLALGMLVLLAGGCAAAPAVPSPFAGRVEASASVDRTQVAFGDELTLTLDVRADPALELELEHAGSFEGFRTVASGQAPAGGEDGVRVERRWYRLRAERAGALTLPALTVRYRDPVTRADAPAERAASAGAGKTDDTAAMRDGAAVAAPDPAGAWSTVETEPLTVQVESLLTAAHASGETPPELRDIKPLQPIDRPRPWPWVAGAIAAIAAAAAAVAYLMRRRRRAEPEEPAVPAVPAHEIALAALDRLAAMELADDEAVRRLYFAVSEVVRAYVEGQFALNATDLTTEEILASLDRLDLGESAARDLRSFLGDTDRVKFAKHRPQRTDVETTLSLARRFVEQTKPAEQAPAAQSEGARAAA